MTDPSAVVPDPFQIANLLHYSHVPQSLQISVDHMCMGFRVKEEEEKKEPTWQEEREQRDGAAFGIRRRGRHSSRLELLRDRIRRWRERKRQRGDERRRTADSRTGGEPATMVDDGGRNPKSRGRG
ncbi:hypothetical protein L1049_018513 [Liquidambar formosana]|uniref:Uncharacterized protein n=1 Tax=Liquidambar formosana TaxID=63359 RepID=A0AAP0RAY2_LIQFO